MKKTLSVLILIAMLVSSFSFAVFADEELVNLYDYSKTTVGIPSTSSVNGAVSNNLNYHASNAIEVKPGDKIYFGPVLDAQSYYLTSYNEAGRSVNQKIALADVKIHAKFEAPNTLICEWTVPAGVASFKMATSQMFRDSTLITKNQPYDANAYIKHMESKNINVDHMKITETNGALDNKFPKASTTFDGRVDGTGAEVAAAQYRTSDFIPVKGGDVLYFAAAAADQGYHLVIFDKNKKGLTTVNKNYMLHYEDLGRGYMTFAYVIRHDAAYVKVVAATGVYDDGIELVTINQPFSGNQYRKLYNIHIDDTPQKPGSSLCGKTALFMGDSITYGAGDSATYYRNGRSWAARIAQITGLKATNAGVSGAKASYIGGDDTAKWLFNQLVAHKDEKFDIVVMHGGVNDARHNRIIGDIQDTTDMTQLKANIKTYIGGLQYLFANVKLLNPDADLFFIANHRLDGHETGQAKNMAPYFDKAKELCEKYGIHFIDLYNNKELNDKLETTTTKYLPDTLHLNAAGYDIITPYIIEALEAVVKPAETEPPVTDAPTEAPAETTEDPGETEKPDKGCSSIITNAPVILILLFAPLAIKKKEN